MGTGYTRNDTSNNIADGNVINASDLDGEYDAIESAFGTSGHTHDGTSGEGGPVTVLGPVQDFVASASEIKPKTNNTLDIGTSALQFKDLYLDGLAYIDGLGETMLVSGSSSIQFRDTAISINSSTDGQLDIDADTEIEITSPTVDINASTVVNISTDLIVGDDLTLQSDAAVLNFGADSDVSLTHVADTGLLLNAGSAIQFRDSALAINSSTDGQLDIIADTQLEITTPTLELNSDSQVIAIGADGDVTITHEADTGLKMKAASGFELNLQTGDTSVESGNVLGKITFNAPSESSGSDALLDGAAIEAVSEATFASDNNSTALVFKTNTSAAATERMRLSSDGHLKFKDNNKAVFGDGGDLEIYHDGSNSVIKDNGTGKLILDTDGTAIEFQKAGLETIATFSTDGAVELYHDNSKKLETTSSGIDVTGTVTADGLTVDKTDTGTYSSTAIDDTVLITRKNSSGTNNQVVGIKFDVTQASGSTTGIAGISAIQPTNASSADLVFQTRNSGTIGERMRINSSGDVGIGDTDPSSPLVVKNASDGKVIVANTAQGGGQGLGFFTDTSNNRVGIFNNSSGTLDMVFNCEGIATSGEAMRIVNDTKDIGIGLSDPTSPLSVQADSTDAEAVSIIGRSSDDIGQLRFYENDHSTNLGELQYRQDHLNFRHRVGYMSFATGGVTERLRISSTGNVHITDNTNGPDAALHIEKTTPQIRLQLNGNSGYNTIASVDSNELAFGRTGTEHARFDNDGQFGIGTDSPNANLNVQRSNDETYSTTSFPNATANFKKANNSGTANQYSSIRLQVTNDNASTNAQGVITAIKTSASTHATTLAFQTRQSGGSVAEAFRVDDSQNFLVGKTSIGFSSDGFEARANGQVYITDTTDVPLVVRKNSADGDIVNFFKDDTKVGIIAVGGSSAQPAIGSANTSAGGTAAGLRFDCANNSIEPWNVVSNALVDDTIDLGLSNIRFDDIFATNSTINTSDENEKQDIAPMTTAELAVGKRLSTLFKTFRWKSKVTEKADKARTHSGIIAQEVKAAFEAEGLDATKYALFCSDTWWEKEISVDAVEADEEKGIEAKDAYTYIDNKYVKTEGYSEKTRLGVRYPELLSFIASYNESRFTAIEARLTALEGA